MAGKEITLRIELNDDNILLSSTVYYAIDAYLAGVTSESTSVSTNTVTETSNCGDVSYMFKEYNFIYVS